MRPLPTTQFKTIRKAGLCLPTPPSTKNNRSRRHQAQEHSVVGLPTPSTSARKQTGSQHAHDHRASPISKSRRLGGDGIDLEAAAEGESASSETEQTTTTMVTEKRWLGRRGTRRPGLTFAQQMGLLVARPAEQHRHSTTNVVPSEWRPTGIANGITEGVVEKSFYFNAESVSVRERSEIKLSLSKNATIQENPFLDDTDRSSTQIDANCKKVPTQLRKTASGRLLHPVNVISPEPLTRDLGETASDVGSDTEKEQAADEEEEDDSPYLIENSDPSPAHDSFAQGVVDDVREQDSRSFIEGLDDSSDLSDMSDTEHNENGPASITKDDGYSSVELASDGSQTTIKTGGRRPPSITSFLSATKGSSSDVEKNLSATPRPSSIPGRRPKKFRERKTWSKPVLGDEEDNPFIASSVAGKPKNRGSETEAGGSWLRTDNAKNRRSEGEKPTIDYLFRGQKTTFANPYYRHDPYRPPATSLLPPEHPEFSPAPVPAPRMLFPQANTGEGSSSDDDNDKAMLRKGRRDILPGHMASSPTASSSAVPIARTLQRRISSQIPPMARQGSTLLEKAQRVQTRRPAQSQPITQHQNGAQKRSMDAVLDGAAEGNDDEDELLLRNPRAGRRMLFGAGAGAAGSRAHSDQLQNGQAVRTTANKKVKMEHIMGE